MNVLKTRVVISKGDRNNLIIHQRGGVCPEVWGIRNENDPTQNSQCSSWLGLSEWLVQSVSP